VVHETPLQEFARQTAIADPLPIGMRTTKLEV